MSDPNLINYVGLAVAGTGVGIGGRIIFDWLKNRNGNQSKKQPEQEQSVSEQLDVHSALGSSECFKWKKGVDTCLATHESVLNAHEKRLDKGSEDFEGIKKNIASIDKSMAVLANEIKKDGG